MGEPGSRQRRWGAALAPWLLWLATLAAVALGSFLTLDALEKQAQEHEAALLAADAAADRARAAQANAAALQQQLDAVTTQRDALARRADELTVALAQQEAERAAASVAPLSGKSPR